MSPFKRRLEVAGCRFSATGAPWPGRGCERRLLSSSAGGAARMVDVPTPSSGERDPGTIYTHS